MDKEIVNRVAQSSLITIDLAEIMGKAAIKGLDISPWLVEGLLLREKDFRDSVANHTWESYRDAHVHVYCSTDAIVPTWAFMLVATKLSGVAATSIVGSKKELTLLLFRKLIEQLNLSNFRDQRVVVKGCSDEEIAETIYFELAQKLTPVVKTLMFGEPCSTVPLFKK